MDCLYLEVPGHRRIVKNSVGLVTMPIILSNYTHFHIDDCTPGGALIESFNATRKCTTKCYDDNNLKTCYGAEGRCFLNNYKNQYWKRVSRRFKSCSIPYEVLNSRVLHRDKWLFISNTYKEQLSKKNSLLPSTNSKGLPLNWFHAV